MQTPHADPCVKDSLKLTDIKDCRNGVMYQKQGHPSVRQDKSPVVAPRRPNEMPKMRSQSSHIFQPGTGMGRTHSGSLPIDHWF